MTSKSPPATQHVIVAPLLDPFSFKISVVVRFRMRNGRTNSIFATIILTTRAYGKLPAPLRTHSNLTDHSTGGCRTKPPPVSPRQASDTPTPLVQRRVVVTPPAAPQPATRHPHRYLRRQSARSPSTKQPPRTLALTDDPGGGVPLDPPPTYMWEHTPRLTPLLLPVAAEVPALGSPARSPGAGLPTRRIHPCSVSTRLAREPSSPTFALIPRCV